jgi:ribosome-associated toxin RatA of RatAB toxin-antitoxin module
MINAPLEFSHEKIMDFREYPKIISYIRQVIYDQNARTVDVYFIIFKYQFGMKFHFDVKKEATVRFINWNVVQGEFLGMKGQIKESFAEKEKTEILADVSYTNKSLPLPEVILNPLLKIVGENSANKMRNYIESEWVKSKKANLERTK